MESWQGADPAGLLIYEEPSEGTYIPFFGFRRDTLPPPLTGNFSLKSIGRMCFSSAPLDPVVSAQVFYGDHREFCRGILFTYRNGGQKAIGECRVHVDRTEVFLEPSEFYFQHCSYTLYSGGTTYNRIRVRFQTEQSQDLEDDEWGHVTVEKGMILDLWFSDRNQSMSFRKQSHK